jgi:hypothetical protein
VLLQGAAAAHTGNSSATSRRPRGWACEAGPMTPANPRARHAGHELGVLAVEYFAPINKARRRPGTQTQDGVLETALTTSPVRVAALRGRTGQL